MIPSALPIIVEAGQGETTLLPENASQVWKATGETTDGALDLWVEVVPPRLGPPQHLHAHHDEFFWIVKGTFLVKVADRIARVSEGALLFIPRGIAHAFQNVGTETGYLLIGILPGGVMRAYFEELRLLLLSGPVDQQAITDRTIINAWQDPGVHEAITRTGRRKVIIAGTGFDICAHFPVLSSMAEGYDTYVVVGASGRFDPSPSLATITRLAQAGVALVNARIIVLEMMADNAHPKASKIYAALPAGLVTMDSAPGA